MSFENNKKAFTSGEVERIEKVDSDVSKETLQNRMQDILDQDGPLSESDKVELDHLEVELRELDEQAEKKLNGASSEKSDPLVLGVTDMVKPVVGGHKQIDAEELPTTHRPGQHDLGEEL